MVLVLTLSACSGDDQSGTVTSTLVKTIEISSTIQVPIVAPTSTSVAAPPTLAMFVDLGPREVGLSSLPVLPTCSVVSRTTGSIGTVPLPTATPLPSAEEISQEDLDHAFATADLVIQYAGELILVSEENWLNAETDFERANQVYLELKKLESLCGVLPISLAIDQTTELVVSIVSALSARITALGSIWEALEAGNGVSDYEELRIETAENFLTLSRDAAFYSSRKGATSERTVRVGIHNGNQIDAGVDVPDSWLVTRDDSQLIGVAPSYFQSTDIDELGPESWDLGIAFRLRRFSSNLLLRQSERELVLSGLMSGIGNEISSSATEFSDYTLIKGEYVADSISWRVLAAILIEEQSSYLLELACDDSEQKSCDTQFQELLDSLVSR